MYLHCAVRPALCFWLCLCSSALLSLFQVQHHTRSFPHEHTVRLQAKPSFSPPKCSHKAPLLTWQSIIRAVWLWYHVHMPSCHLRLVRNVPSSGGAALASQEVIKKMKSADAGKSTQWKGLKEHDSVTFKQTCDFSSIQLSTPKTFSVFFLPPLKKTQR